MEEMKASKRMIPGVPQLRTLFVVGTLLLCAVPTLGQEFQPPYIGSVTVDRKVVLSGRPFSLMVELQWDYFSVQRDTDASLALRVTRGDKTLHSGLAPLFTSDGLLAQAVQLEPLEISSNGRHTLLVELALTQNFTDIVSFTDVKVWTIPGGLTLLPPVVAIILAAWSGQILLSLFLGTWLASFFIYRYNPVVGLLAVLDYFISSALADFVHAQIILFSWFLAGMVYAVYKAGGMDGMAASLSRFAKTRRTVQLAVLAMGVLIFFDDYCNSLLVGMTMRPVTDLLWVSREKLAYLVDSTSGPITALFPISTWTGLEVGIIKDELDYIKQNYPESVQNYDSSAYTIFLKSLPYRFYPLFLIVFQFFLVFTNREAGPMLLAERRAKYEHKLHADNAEVEMTQTETAVQPEATTPRRWWNLFVPVIVTIMSAVVAIILTGTYASREMGIPTNIENIFSNADAFNSLIYATFLGNVAAFFMTTLQYSYGGHIYAPTWLRWTKLPTHPDAVKLLTVAQYMHAWITGVKQITLAILTLIMAWAIGAAMDLLGSGEFLAYSLKFMDARVMPMVVFLLSACTSFGIGTSWGTLSIILPLAVPLAVYSAPGNQNILLLAISAVVSGSVYGGQCSYYSDTVVITSMSTKCDLRHHVRTQLPYATFIMLTSALLGFLPAGYGGDRFPPYAALLVGLTGTLILAFLLTVPVNCEKLDPCTKLYFKLVRRKVVNADGREIKDVEGLEGIQMPQRRHEDYL